MDIDTKVNDSDRTPSSLRDPFGFLTKDKEGTLVRYVDRRLAHASRVFLHSDLYSNLVKNRRFVDHDEVDSNVSASGDSLLLQPRKIPIVTYPYEWPFSLLKKAALLTVDIQREAIDAGFTLRDGTAFNVLFEGVRPIFIDFGSFDVLTPGQPWAGYKQFCEHFLAPLALAASFRNSPNIYNSVTMDGYPLGIASSMMPIRSWMNWGLLWHLHLHSRAISKGTSNRARDPGTKHLSSRSLNGLLASLRNAVNALKYHVDKGDWATYYADNSYSSRAMAHKEELVDIWLSSRPESELILDLGGNAGRFSAIASKYSKNVILVDSDHDSVELAVREFDNRGITNIHSALHDLTDPFMGRGWAGSERPGFYDRIKPQTSLALALIHHLVIGAGIPMERVAAHFRDITPSLIIEFIPQGDPMVDLLSTNKKGQHHEYSLAKFEQAFTGRFSMKHKQELSESGRVLYEFAAQS
ncbi:MAG: hypothetical protein VYC65_00510 [Chloroflexota bacterium]|nr:hypothetical protein [Chloroflexota bacterium]